MARYTGTALWVGWITASGTLILSDYGREFSVEDVKEDVDGTTYSDARRYHLPSIGDFTASMTILDDGGTSINSLDLNAGQKGTLAWAPLGTADSGNPYHAAAAYIESISANYPYDDVVSVDVSWQGQGEAPGWGGTVA